MQAVNQKQISEFIIHTIDQFESCVHVLVYKYCHTLITVIQQATASQTRDSRATRRTHQRETRTRTDTGGAHQRT